ncbi:MAG: flagellar hook-length control protein FliK [Deltaproteobacteria bacterium]|nr:flagellar hook-length control protein FliK [Deltaproteobacteria bacterium]MBW2151761.1 flagellar hook-length control protein FliK [Deltaproteobacteria bacterium]
MNLPGLEILRLLENFQPAVKQTLPVSPGSSMFSEAMKGALQAAAANSKLPVAGGKEIPFEDIHRFKGKALIQHLKRCLLSSGISLEQVFANEQAISSLKTLLIAAGFRPSDIAEVLDSLEKTPSGRGVRLSNLFDRLERLDDQQSTEPLLTLSSLPFIESILYHFLRDPVLQRTAIEGAVIEDEGIILSRLISNLKQILKSLEDSGKSIPDPLARDQILKLMHDLGMDSNKGPVTLDRFVQELQALAVKASKSTDFQQTRLISLNRFIKNLQYETETHGQAERFIVSGNTKTATMQDARAKASGRMVPDTASIGKRAVNDLNGPMSKTGFANTADAESEGEPNSVAGALKEVENPITPSQRLVTTAQRAPVRTLPGYVLNQVGRQIMRSVQNGNQQVQLQLKPPHLGRLNLHIEGGGDGIRVSIVTEHQGTQDLLLSNAGELKSVLMEQGIKLEKIDIQLGHFFDQSTAFERRESNRTPGKRQRRSDAAFGSDSEALIMEDEPATIRISKGLLDLVA